MDALNPERYSELLKFDSLAHLEVDEAVEIIGLATDWAGDHKDINGIERVIAWGDEVVKRASGRQLALFHYFMGNAWSHARILRYRERQRSWWENPEDEQWIIHLRNALLIGPDVGLESARRCQVLTNLGNTLSEHGRVVEAIACWDAALAIDPRFAMASGQRGYGFFNYGRLIEDSGHRSICFWQAHDDLALSLEGKLEDDLSRRFFQRMFNALEANLPGFFQRPRPTLRNRRIRSKLECRYRHWALRHRLFLNPLNDLRTHLSAARDPLVLPSMVVPLNAGPDQLGFFNQLKQEYISARFLAYEGISQRRPHFSDREVAILNTLDYPSHSYSTEQTKVAYRVAYSLFDKIAFFLNDYLELGIPEREVKFRGLWYEKIKENGQMKVQFRSSLEALRSYPLRGLFWLSKDLYERDTPGFRAALLPEARDLDEIRNHLEHKYLKLHLGEWGGPEQAEDSMFAIRTDRLAHSLYRSDFEAKTLTLLRMARAGLIYLALAVGEEERRRRKDRGPNSVSAPVWWRNMDDDWKE